MLITLFSHSCRAAFSALFMYACLSQAVYGKDSRCASVDSSEVFSAVENTAEALLCNDTGYWQASYGALLEFVFIPGGRFIMGSDDGLGIEKPVRKVWLDGYWISKYPTTVAQFRDFVAETGYVTDAERGWGAWQWNGDRMTSPDDEGDPWELRMDGRWNNPYFEQGDDHPVGSVSWNDANAYAAWLSGHLGAQFVLPTEAQWEKSARGASGRRFPWGDERPDERHANLADRRFADKYGAYARNTDSTVDDGYTETSPVDAYAAGQSKYGIYDLAGNLGEWVYDLFSPDYYSLAPDRNPTGPDVPPGAADQFLDRVNRGGSWVDWAGVSTDGQVRPEGGHNIRSAARTGDEQNSSDDHMGFRLAIDGRRTAVVKPPDPLMPDLTDVTMVIQVAGKRVYMLEASGDVAGNIAALVGPDGVLVVDDQFAELVPVIERTLGQLTHGDLRYIINTHHHGDHSDGNARLSADNDAVIIAHDLARMRMLDRGPGNWPVLTFNNSMTLYFNDEVIRLISVLGGHTDNDVIVFFEYANVVHLGDLMNSGKSSFPTADLEGGGNALKMQENIEFILELIDDDTTIIPGHGPISDKAELMVVHQMLVDTISLVREKRRRGDDLAAIIREGVPARYKEWGYGYMSAEGWLEMIYHSL